MPKMLDKQYRKELDGRVDLAVNPVVAGDELALIVDYHFNTDDIFHGPPPHLYALVNKDKIPRAGLGYAPFGWVRGWVYAQDWLRYLMMRYKPYAIQWGVSPHIRNGWGFLNGERNPASAAYNDTLGILREALVESSHRPNLIIIPKTPGSSVGKNAMINMRDKLASSGITNVMLEFDDDLIWAETVWRSDIVVTEEDWDGDRFEKLRDYVSELERVTYKIKELLDD